MGLHTNYWEDLQMTNLKATVHYNGEKIEIAENTEVHVFECGMGTATYGENAKLTKILKNNLVFKTDSGTIVKTEINTLNTVGKAEKHGFSIALGKVENRKDVHIQAMEYYL